MPLQIRNWLLLIVVMTGLIVGGCETPKATSLNSEKPSALATTSVAASPSSSPQAINLPKLTGKATVVLTVKGSPITIEVDGTNAPITAGNFVDLVQRGVYDGLVFHRVVREPKPFVVQGGDPQGKDPKFPVERLGTGGFVDPVTSKPRYIPLEIKPKGSETPVYSNTFETAGINKLPQLQHTRGAVAMARSQMPDSASSQFYITLAEQSFLDGNYAVFGYVTEGMEVVDKIQQGDRIDSAKVTKGIENFKDK